VPWFDTDGNRIYAGGANMYLESGRYYLVGEGNKTHEDCSECFNLYSSTDLETWKFEACVLKNEDVRAAAPPPLNSSKYAFYRIERPKVFKCPGASTRPYRIWFHCDTSDFAMKSVGVLTSDSITGPYTFAGQCFRPDDHDSYDMGVWYDDPAQPGGDGHMYLVRSVDNSYAGISRMNDDCTTVTGGIISGQGTPKMEAQALMRDDAGILHMIGSHETGWSPNAALFLTSPNASLLGAVWGDDYNPSGDGSTWDSQSTFLFPYRHADGHVTHIWMADRWNEYGPGSIQNDTLIWLPLQPPSGPAPTNVTEGWTIQLNTCNASDPTQQFAWHKNATVTHVLSGLCVAQTEQPGPPMIVQRCETGNAAQTWYHTGSAFSNTSFGFGANCVNWNAGNGDAQGALVMTYRCGNSTQWNSRWDAPINPSTPGLFQALSDVDPSGFCISASPARNPSLWALPWQSSWSLKDF